jgi:hypothetical protein
VKCWIIAKQGLQLRNYFARGQEFSWIRTGKKPVGINIKIDLSFYLQFYLSIYTNWRLLNEGEDRKGGESFYPN